MARCPKFAQYVASIEEHVIEPLQKRSGVGESCFASLMLIFACCDGLGRLLHEDEAARPGTRFMSFMRWLGPAYEERQRRLWDLRNELDHNALNVGAFVSKAELSETYHLRECGITETILVNTPLLLQDFRTALARVIDAVSEDERLAEQVESRLEERIVDESDFREVPTTPAPLFAHVRVRGPREPRVCVPVDVWDRLRAEADRRRTDVHELATQILREALP